jgi:hypothetical protein
MANWDKDKDGKIVCSLVTSFDVATTMDMFGLVKLNYRPHRSSPLETSSSLQLQLTEEQCRELANELLTVADRIELSKVPSSLRN